MNFEPVPVLPNSKEVGLKGKVGPEATLAVGIL